MFLALSSNWGCIAVLSWPTDIWGKNWSSYETDKSERFF